MEMKTMLLHLVSKGAVQIETSFLNADRREYCNGSLPEPCLFYKKKTDLLVQCFLLHLNTKDTEVTF